MTMDKETVKYLMEQGIKPEARLINFKDDRWVNIDNDGSVKEIAPRSFIAQDSIVINTLNGFINYIKANLERKGSNLIAHVVDEKHIKLMGTLECDGNREILAEARAIIPMFRFGDFYDMEGFNISLQSKFVDLKTEIQDDDRAVLLQVVGNVQEENVRSTGDDGVSQAITIKKGVNSTDALIPNPVTLAPYRTFLEVNQPASQFIFRMKDGPRAAIFEADGGAWRNQAICNIREYLKEELAEDIETGRITILA